MEIIKGAEAITSTWWLEPEAIFLKSVLFQRLLTLPRSLQGHLRGLDFVGRLSFSQRVVSLKGVLWREVVPFLEGTLMVL